MFLVDGSEMSRSESLAWILNLEQHGSLGKRLACQFRKGEVGLDVVYMVLFKSFGFGVSLLLISLHFLIVAA
jgi:hypothetical protein